MADRLIENDADLAGLLATIPAGGVVALDTEAASFHRFHDRVYLVQLSTGDTTAVIDPLTVDLAPVGRLLADPDVQKIFHDADYDLRLLNFQYGFTARNLFDTRIAAQLAGEPGIGLAALLEKYFGVRPDKRFQRADWSGRPLTEAMLDYAMGDTRHLERLRDTLAASIESQDRTSWIEEEFALLEEVKERREPADPRTHALTMKGARALERRQLAILQEVYTWREETAANLDRASFRVIGNEAIFAVVAAAPTTMEALSRIRGVGRDLAERRGREILAAVARGLAVPEEALPSFPRGLRHRPDPAYEERLARLKERRNLLAERFGLLPGVICPNGILEGIARLAPATVADLAAIPGMRRWQQRELGPELLAALAA